ncbi:MAG: trigger factor [Phycisphaerales bacterium]|nr:trigger factor [Phycisphaerales bacterium]MCI0676735.1 trigger factor [Phycisphaerales bacterium]
MSPATATTEPTTSTNQVKIEDAGPARKRLTITIPAHAINDKLAESMTVLAGQTVLPGFRKGHVPQKLLERRFGTSVRTETKNQLIASAYATAIEEHKLKPVGEPEPGDDMKTLELEPGKAMTFSLEVEVVPSFELPALDTIEVKKPMVDITDERIAQELERQQLMHGVASRIESDFTEGDRLGGYATVTKEDETEPFFRQDNVIIIIPGKADGGRGQVLGLMIEGLRDQLIDRKIGDKIVIETVGPESHERDDIRGVKLTIEFELRQAERVAPAEPAVVAQKYGLTNEEILREQIKLALEHRRDDEQAAAMREQAVEQLAELVEFELPEKMSAQQSARHLEQYRLELLYRGSTPEEVEEKLAETRSDSLAEARRRLKHFFLLQRLAEHFQVEVSEQEVNGRIALIAAQRNVRPEKLRTELSQSGRLGEVARLIRDEKAAQRVVEQVKQVEISAEEWNDLVKKKKQGGKTPAKTTRTRKSAAKSESDEPAKPAAKSEATPKKKTSRKK